MKEFIESQDLLQTIAVETEKNSVEAKRLVSGLSEEQLNWTSSPDKWSIAQCLDHLTVTTSRFEQYFSAAIKRGHEKYPVSSAVVYRPSRIGGWLIKQLMPESTKKVPVPKSFRPSQSAINGALENFLIHQDAFLNFVKEAGQLDYNKTRLRSPVTPLMRYSLADAFVVTVVHGRRHLAQAWRMRETPGFPN
jgi:DinB family protein